MLLKAAVLLCAVAGISAGGAVGGKKGRVQQPGRVRGPKDPNQTPAGVLISVRFDCSFPFCPTTALDIVTIDEHYVAARPTPIATLIPFTPTTDMNFFAYADFDNATRMHYTLAARQINNAPVNQLFTTRIEYNGTNGSLVNTAIVPFPADAPQSSITYLFTAGGLVYISFAEGILLTVDPKTGSVLNETRVLPSNTNMTDGLACSFDQKTLTFYANSIDIDENFFLHSYQVTTGARKMVGPLPPYSGAPSPRIDVAVASLAVYPPTGGPMQLLELRTSSVAPFLAMVWLDPVSGNSTFIQMPNEWWQSFDIDPNYYPTQWKGSLRRVWTWDPINNWAWFKLYDECSYVDDCDEDDTIVYLDIFNTTYNDWYVAVEPEEPELTQLTWAWTNRVD